jgi:hypothetical protein
MTTQDKERSLEELQELWQKGSDLLKKHPNIFSYFSGGEKRDISPDEEREISALAEAIKEDAMKGSRDLPSGNVSSERWLPVLIGAVTTGYQIYKDNPGAVKVLGSVVKKLWPW